MKGLKRSDYPLRWIPARDLSVVWLEAQRPRNEKEEARLADEFDPDALDPLTVTQPNDDGLYHVIDGQTRLGAIRRLWGDDERVPCRVLSTKSKKEAARIWRTMNRGHKKPQAIEDFRVAVTAEDKDAVAVNAIVEKAGLKVSTGDGDKYIACVATLLRIYRKRGAADLALILDLVIETWGVHKDAWNGSIIEGFAVFTAAHPVFDRKRLASKLCKRYTPARLVGAAKQHRDMFRGTMPKAIETLMVNEYNMGLRTGARLGEEQ